MTILKRKPKENNREYSYRVLYHNIMTLRLPPGATINENEAAEQLKISRTPVHEALSLLKEEYLVDIVPQSGSSVSLINLRNMREGLFMRMTLEPAIYKQLAGSISEEYLHEMSLNLEESRNCLNTGTEEAIADFIHLDDEFHKIAYFAAQKPNLWKATSVVCSHFSRIRYQESLLLETDLSHILADHRKLYDYLLLGGYSSFDLEAFYESHLYFFEKYFSDILNKYPNYFQHNENL